MKKINKCALKCILFCCFIYFVISRMLSSSVVQHKVSIDNVSTKIYRSLGSRNVTDMIQLTRNSAIISPVHSTNAVLARSKFIVIVVTYAENIPQRQLIRETWGQPEIAVEATTIVLFFMGKPKSENLQQLMQTEAELFDDIIVDDWEEDVYTSSIKTLRMFKWYYKNYAATSDFLVKTEDHVFLNLRNVLNHLNRISEDEILSGYVGGSLYDGFGFAKEDKLFKQKLRDAFSTDVRSIDFIPPGLWNGGHYPPYLSNNFMVISERVIPYILNVSANIPLYHLEDVFISGMLVSWTLRLDLRFIPSLYDRHSVRLLNRLAERRETKNIIAYNCNGHGSIMRKLHTRIRQWDLYKSYRNNSF